MSKARRQEFLSMAAEAFDRLSRNDFEGMLQLEVHFKQGRPSRIKRTVSDWGREN